MCVDNSEWTRNGDYAPTRFQVWVGRVRALAHVCAVCVRETGRCARTRARAPSSERAARCFSRPLTFPSALSLPHFQAQADAVNLLAGAKTQANPENAVGVLTMAGKAPRVLVTPTPDLGKVLNAMQVRERERKKE